MTAHDPLDRQLDVFLKDGPTELPEASFYAVRDRIDQTGQRVVIGPWRMPNAMNKFAVLGLGAAVVVAIVVGMQFLPAAPGGVGGASSASPSASPTPTSTPQATGATASPSAATAPTPPPLTGSFTSTLHGYAMSYPEGWTTQPATQPWTDRTFPVDFGGHQTDVVYDPIRTSNLFLTVASQPIGQASPADWTTLQMTSAEGCGTTTEPVTVDSATGLIGPEGCEVAVVVTGGRGYWIQLYRSGDDPRAVEPYDRAWFESVLATVQLRPQDAVDVAPSASP